MMVCRACRREITVDQQVVQVYLVKELPPSPELAGRLFLNGLNHANCFDATGPRYNDDGSVIPETARGYVKGRSAHNRKICPECIQGKHGNCFGVADITDHDVSIPCFCPEISHEVSNG